MFEIKVLKLESFEPVSPACMSAALEKLITRHLPKDLQSAYRKRTLNTGCPFKHCRNPTAALHLARKLGAPCFSCYAIAHYGTDVFDRGDVQYIFKEWFYLYSPWTKHVWESPPELVVKSSGRESAEGTPQTARAA
jgi:hypothetical protein